MHLEIGVVAVGLAGEQCLDAAPLRLLIELLEHSFAFGDGGVVVLRLAELDERDAVF